MKGLDCFAAGESGLGELGQGLFPPDGGSVGAHSRDCEVFVDGRSAREISEN